MKLTNTSASFVGENSWDFSGYSLAFAGDVNGDGAADFLIGAPRNGEGEVYPGQTYLFLGTPWIPEQNVPTLSHWGIIVMTVVFAATVSRAGRGRFAAKAKPRN
ncbi:MAG: IPTL-CTERM sorting domain-containing protein [Chloroflexi bacterium]|nr:IPTL-CTERM sorting domain-containing protein [Chloroflexota bacterium]